jgi:mRNA-degrading endonuclease RelE of RelBE toxin-antitoxin system
MSYKVIPAPLFKKQAKRLAKKFPSLKEELTELSNSLASNPNQGTSLGHNAYKIRLAVQSKGKGKSGGMRVITYLVTEEQEVFLLTIYDKSEMDTVDDKTLRALIRDIMQ